MIEPLAQQQARCRALKAVYEFRASHPLVTHQDEERMWNAYRAWREVEREVRRRKRNQAYRWFFGSLFALGALATRYLTSGLPGNDCPVCGALEDFDDAD